MYIKLGEMLKFERSKTKSSLVENYQYKVYEKKLNIFKYKNH